MKKNPVQDDSAAEHNLAASPRIQEEARSRLFRTCNSDFCNWIPGVATKRQKTTWEGEGIGNGR